MTEKKVPLDSLVTVVHHLPAVQLGKTEMFQHICYAESEKRNHDRQKDKKIL